MLRAECYVLYATFSNKTVFGGDPRNPPLAFRSIIMIIAGSPSGETPGTPLYYNILNIIITANSVAANLINSYKVIANRIYSYAHFIEFR